jgi:Protein of unknown function (DUF1592)/Protein of unknown function (DUF1588)/Protein of unknown function (DUF1595)/Protein of unknown function (DUF1585)
MSDEARVPASRLRRLRWLANLGTAGALLTAIAAGGAQGCSAKSSGSPPPGSGGDDGGSSVGLDAGGGGQLESGAACNGASNGVIVPKRLVRLTFNQIVNAIGSLLNFVPIPGANGGAATNIEAQLTTTYMIVDSQHRSFPPLTNLSEGPVINVPNWTQSDAIAQDTAKFVFNNFAAVTKCTTASDACAQAWLANFSTAAFRRPLTSAESSALTPIYTADRSNGGTVQEATQYEVYAIFSSPWFLYRTEFGTDTEDMTAATMAGPLAPYELANAISFYLTDNPPDSPLLAAAAGNQLSPAQVQAQVNRIIAAQEPQANLEAAMFSYFSIQGLDVVVIDPSVYSLNQQMRNSMRHEVELFLHDHLWSGVIGDLLTSTQSRINQNLATLYNVSPFPQSGQTPDSDGFALTQMPNERSGILTQAGFLTSKARPMAGSIIARGLIVNASFLCAENPGPPTSALIKMQVASQSADMTKTDRQKADFRAATVPCNGCHPHFDPYGEALGAYDLVGEFKPNNPDGTPIDTSALLPANAGGAKINGPVEMAQALTTAQGAPFTACMAKNLLAYALADAVVGGTVDSCAVGLIAQNAGGASATFSTVLAQVAASPTFSTRLGGM